MELLRINKLLLNTMGLLKANNESGYFIWLTVFWLIFALILVPPSVTYVYENITDTTKTTEIIYVIATNISSAIKTGYFLFHRDSINAILKRLQKIVDEREAVISNKDFQIYQNTEKTTSILSKALIVALSILAMTALNIPICFVLFHYLNGDYSPSLWYLPYKLSVPDIDLSITPFFEITYVIIYLMTWSTVIIYCTVELYYVNVCLQLTACLTDLKQSIKVISSEFGKEKTHCRSNGDEVFRLLVNLHTETLGLARLFSFVIGKVIFFVVIACVIVLCTSLFQLVLNTAEGSALFFCHNVAIAIFGCGPLFLYCYFGDLLTQALTEVSDVLFNESKWYVFPLKLRTAIVIMMRQSQKRSFMCGFGLRAMECSLENFTNLVKFTSSSLTVLRSTIK